MRTPALIAAFLAAALLPFVGCDQTRSAVSPTVPSAPTAPAPVGPQGQITVLSVKPESGATLSGEPCDGGYCIERNVGFTFDVQLDQAVAEPWVTVSLYNGLQRCAGSGYPNIFQTIEPLRANTATTFTVSFLALSDHTGILCPLPQTTTRMVVQLWAQRGRTILLTREFALNYTFVLP